MTNRIFLSDTEKVLLSSLIKNNGFNRESLDGFSDIELGVAAEYLKEKRLMRVAVNYGEIVDAIALPRGEVYLKDNPTLENPVSEEEIRRLQKDEMEYKKQIRKQESVIRLWQTVSAISGFIAITSSLFAFLKP